MITINARHTTPVLLNMCLFLSLFLWFVLVIFYFIFSDFLMDSLIYLAAFAGKEYTFPNLLAYFVLLAFVFIFPPFGFYFGLKPLFHTNTIVEFSEYSIRIKRHFYVWGIIPCFGWFGPYDRTKEHHFYPDDPVEIKMFRIFGTADLRSPPFILRKAAESVRVILDHEQTRMEVATICGDEKSMQFINRVENVDRYMAEFVHLCNRNRPV